MSHRSGSSNLFSEIVSVQGTSSEAKGRSEEQAICCSGSERFVFDTPIDDQNEIITYVEYIMKYQELPGRMKIRSSNSGSRLTYSSPQPSLSLRVY